MTATTPRPAGVATAEPTPSHSADAALRFERCALAAIRHSTHYGTHYGLFTAPVTICESRS